MNPWPYNDHWAVVSRATQLQAHYREELRRQERRRFQLKAGVWLVRLGLRLAGPLTVDGVLDPA